jgi:hypothetical protein
MSRPSTGPRASAYRGAKQEASEKPPAAHTRRAAHRRRAVDTGVPNKDYRGAKRVSSLGDSQDAHKNRANRHKTAFDGRVWWRISGYRGAKQGLPGCQARITGVPNKDYRGAKQGLPGCQTRTTGVPNKDYRGAKQTLTKNYLQILGFLAIRSTPLYVCLFSTCLFDNNMGGLRDG